MPGEGGAFPYRRVAQPLRTCAASAAVSASPAGSGTPPGCRRGRSGRAPGPPYAPGLSARRAAAAGRSRPPPSAPRHPRRWPRPASRRLVRAAHPHGFRRRADGRCGEARRRRDRLGCLRDGRYGWRCCAVALPRAAQGSAPGAVRGRRRAHHRARRRAHHRARRNRQGGEAVGGGRRRRRRFARQQHQPARQPDDEGRGEAQHQAHPAAPGRRVGCGSMSSSSSASPGHGIGCGPRGRPGHIPGRILRQRAARGGDPGALPRHGQRRRFGEALGHDAGQRAARRPARSGRARPAGSRERPARNSPRPGPGAAAPRHSASHPARHPPAPRRWSDAPAPSSRSGSPATGPAVPVRQRPSITQPSGSAPSNPDAASSAVAAAMAPAGCSRAFVRSPWAPRFPCRGLGNETGKRGLQSRDGNRFPRRL